MFSPSTRPYYKPYCITLVLYLIAALATLLWAILYAEGYIIAMAAVALVLPIVPKALFHLLRWQRVFMFDIIFLCFVFIAVPFASVLGGYTFVPYLDKILHCLSGFLFAAIGTIVFYACKQGHQKAPTDALSAALFSAMFSMSSAVLWEIYEFTLSLFGPDPQLAVTTGVTDTMLDMIVCTIGGIITAVECYRYLKGAKPWIMMRLFENFYDVNLTDKRLSNAKEPYRGI